MGELAAADFDEYFRSVHGHEPYPWQSRLTRRVLDGGGWPDVIDLPTGAGKTAVLDTAVFALAVRPDVSPRRVVFVIDRRIVVDQVYERAQLIRDRIAAAGGGVLGELRRLLGGLTDAGEPLGVAALRGGIPIDGEWARRPDQPSVMVSTVDQFGSRLLFRGYGVSERMRPVHAGLSGNDCLVILDEVHLSAAFAATLRDVSSDGDVPLIRAVNASCLPRRFTVVEMSATPQNRSGNRFQLQDADLDASPRLNRIANAAKRATLVEVGGTRPPHESVPKKVLEILKGELRDHEMSVGVIVNRVRTARETHAMLQRAGYAAHLVTGRMRPIDRQHTLEQITAAVDPDREAPLGERTVVVATQAIEVGADFSFDALISEAAPIDSLTQRLGRLDRRGTLADGRQEPARCWVLGAAPVLNPKRPDPVYGHAVRCAWEQLRASAQDDEIDVGPGTGLLSQTDTNVLAPRPEAPLVLSTHIGAWSQTSPQPVADAPIAEFLHGTERPQEPEVSVVWRWDRSDRALGLVPPRPAESLSVPMSAVKSWLCGAEEAPVSDTASAPAQDDTTGPPRARRGPDSVRSRRREVVRWVRRGDTPAQPLDSVDDITPGALIVVDPALGGLCDGTWDPHPLPAATADGTGGEDAPAPVADLGDEAQLAHGVRPGGGARGVRATLRLDPRLVEDMRVEAAPMPSPADELDASMSAREAVDAWLAEVQRLPSRIPDWLATTVERFGREASFDVEVVEPERDSEAAYYVLVERSVDPAILDESDEAPSLTGTMTPLHSHLEGVGARAAASGARLGLSEEVVADLRLAGELHDLGKVDCRFQAQLFGHDPVRIAESDEPLAKSLPGARTRSGGWPPVRHEFTSVALVRSNPAILEESHDPDLVLHLVGTHHGFGRPLPQIRDDDQPMQLEAAGQLQGGSFRLRAVKSPNQTGGDGEAVLMSTSTDLAGTHLALDMADRFWRLQERYGHHGLAWLEAIFRLADHQQSAEEARHG